MRRRQPLLAVAALLAALGVAACGGEQPTTSGPSSATFTVPGQAEPAASERPPACPRGGIRLTTAQAAVRVADLRGTRAPAPVNLRTSNDLTVECLRWSSWGGARAEGRGVARLVRCTPTCAAGRLRYHPAEVVLSGRRRCDGTPFYTTAKLRLRDADDLPGPPAAYVTPPC